MPTERERERAGAEAGGSGGEWTRLEWETGGSESFEHDRCGSHRRGAGRSGTAGGKWTLHEEPPKYAPDRSCDVTHLRLELTVDLPRQVVAAIASLDLLARYGPFEAITLDAVDLDIVHIRDGAGQDLSYVYLDRKLQVRFRKKVERSERLVITYRKQSPVQGLYFWGPTPEEPKATWQLWSQGEDEEARHWIPCHDAPHEKMTTEVLVTVPEIYTVVSNGALKGVKTRGKRRTWHFYEAVPHSSYLITLVVGVFAKLEDDCDGLPVEYFVEPGREEEGWRSFGRTPDMIRCFARLLQCPFPYEKYAQVAVRHFMFGGMENTSATTQTDATLHDTRAALDFSSEGLVAHELAHQWFGDFLTCKHWAHAWLNEGFATYFESIWKEEDEGADEFEMSLFEASDTYLAESYRRSIVNHRYAFPGQLFDAHLYPKGAWVLHMLRRMLGDDLFWKSVQLYVRRHAVGSVETVDLRRACEEVSGRNLEGFFDQWLYHPGHPELDVRCSWNESERTLQILVKQTQSGADSLVYHLPIEVEVNVADGAIESGTKSRSPRSRAAKPGSASRRVAATQVSDSRATTITRIFEMDRKEQTFQLELPARPSALVLDPRARMLKTWKVQMPFEWTQGALVGVHRSPNVFARLGWVRQATRDASFRTVRLLSEVLRKDPFWGVQAAAALALARIRSPEALKALLDARDLRHAKARRGVVMALGAFREAAAADALVEIVRKGDPSYHVQRDAMIALGRSRSDKAIPLLEKELKAGSHRRDWRDILAAGAATGLSAARSELSVDAVLALARDRSRYWGARLGAVQALASLGAARPLLAPRIAEELATLFEDPDHLVTQRLPDAYVALRYPGAVSLLRQKAATTPNEEVRARCLMAAENLSGIDGGGGDLDRLKSELNRVLEESRELRERVERLEDRSREGLMEAPDGARTRKPPKTAKKRASRATAAGRPRRKTR